MAGNRNEGEGSRSAARDYNKRTADHLKTHDVEGEAKRAREALEGQERDELRRAEEAGKARAKGEDPAVRRDRR